MPAAMETYHDPKETQALAALAQDNSTHRMYGQSLWTGLKDIITRIRTYLRSLKNKPASHEAQPADFMQSQAPQSQVTQTTSTSAQLEQPEVFPEDTQQTNLVETTQSTPQVAVSDDTSETSDKKLNLIVETTEESQTQDVTPIREVSNTLTKSEKTLTVEEHSPSNESTSTDEFAHSRLTEAGDTHETAPRNENIKKEPTQAVDSTNERSSEPTIDFEHDAPISVASTEPIESIVVTTQAIDKPTRRRKAIKTVAKRHKKLYEGKQS